MDALVKRIERDDRRRRISIWRREDGLFFYREGKFVEYDDAPACWLEGYPPSGIFASAAEAEAEARNTIGWLRGDG